jgi:carboxypeptidase C (cathepsin A)
MWTEHGPFVVQADGATLELNPYAWNTVANVVYLEAPAGVGFSFDASGDYSTGDVRTANDNLQALVQFFVKHPQFAGRAFYISGESYAGHYVPELAEAIIMYNMGVPAAQQINLQGVLVGNGLTQENIDFASTPYYLFNHALVSSWTFDAAYAACGNGSMFAACSGYLVDPPCPDACNNALNTLSNEVGTLNPYDIYGDLCLAGRSRGSGTVRGESAAHVMLRHNPLYQRALAARGARALAAGAPISAGPASPLYPAVAGIGPSDDPFVPCIDEYVSTYLNRDVVKAAIHANASITWSDCTQNPAFNYTFNHSSMLPLYDAWATQSSSMRVLVYSGDADSVLPFLGTQWDMQALGRTVTKEWAEWTGSDGQPGGYVIALSHAAGNDLHFLTIKGAGHM